MNIIHPFDECLTHSSTLELETNSISNNVRMFNFVVKTNVETSKEYIINVFSYKLGNKTSDWYHNYMLEFLNCTFSRLT